MQRLIWFPQVPVMSVNEPTTCFSQFGMDLIGPLTTTADGNRFIIVVTDYLTKWPEAVAIPSKHAHVVAKFLVGIICRYSSIKTVITDQDREFCNQVNDVLFQRLKIEHRVCTAYHPQSYGQTERFNQSLCNSLVKYVNDNQDNWDDYIDPILMAYRTAIHKSTQKTPFFPTFGMIESTFPVTGRADNKSNTDDALEQRVAAATDLFKAHAEAWKGKH